MMCAPMSRRAYYVLIYVLMVKIALYSVLSWLSLYDAPGLDVVGNAANQHHQKLKNKVFWVK